MDLRIYARNIELTPAAQDYIRKRFDRLERHLKSRSDAKLEISRTSARSQSERVVAQMTVSTTHRHAPPVWPGRCGACRRNGARV